MFSLKFKHLKPYFIEKQKMHITFDHNVDGLTIRYNQKATEYDDYYVVFVSCANYDVAMNIHLSDEDPKKKGRRK